MRRRALVLLSVFFPTFGLLLYYNTQAALGTTTRTLTRTPDHHAYTHANTRPPRVHSREQAHPRIHVACTWWAAHQAVAPLVAPGENELAT